MIKSFEELFTGLNALYPVSYDRVIQPGSTPFITYIDNGQDDIHNDNEVSIERYNLDIDLNTRQKDLIAERQLKDFFRANKITYQKQGTIYIEEEELYLTTFNIELLIPY